MRTTFWTRLRRRPESDTDWAPCSESHLVVFGAVADAWPSSEGVGIVVRPRSIVLVYLYDEERPSPAAPTR